MFVVIIHAKLQLFIDSMFITCTQIATATELGMWRPKMRRGIHTLTSLGSLATTAAILAATNSRYYSLGVLGSNVIRSVRNQAL